MFIKNIGKEIGKDLIIFGSNKCYKTNIVRNILLSKKHKSWHIFYIENHKELEKEIKQRYLHIPVFFVRNNEYYYQYYGNYSKFFNDFFNNKIYFN